MPDTYNGKRLETIRARHEQVLGKSAISGQTQSSVGNDELIYLYTTIDGLKLEIEALQKEMAADTKVGG